MLQCFKISDSFTAYFNLSSLSLIYYRGNEVVEDKTFAPIVPVLSPHSPATALCKPSTQHSSSTV